MAEKKKGLELLREPFPKELISKLPKGTKAQNECPVGDKKKCEICGGFHHPKVIHLDYVGHAALTDRLLDADPTWSWEPLALREGLPAFDDSGGLWIKLTVCGTTRIGYGHAEKSNYKEIGSREKEVIGDALRNAAMRFGAALELWHKGDLHPEAEPPQAEAPKMETDMPERLGTPPGPSSQAKQDKTDVETSIRRKKAFEAKITDTKTDREKFKLYLKSVDWIKEVDGRLTMTTITDAHVKVALDRWDDLMGAFKKWEATQ
jgi:hypothetical protein